MSGSPEDASAPLPTAAPVLPSPALVLGDLPDDVAFLLKPFLSRRYSAQEKLSALQNAFFLWKIEDLSVIGDLLQTLLSAGDSMICHPQDISTLY